MRKRNHNAGKAKRAVCAGLFLGVLFGMCGCVKPPVQPEVTGTPEPVITSTGIPTEQPDENTPTPGITEPADTSTPVPSAIPTMPVPPTSEPSPTPEATPEPKPTPEPEVTTPPSPSPTPEATPEPTGTITVTEVPEVPITVTPLPLPTGQPDYDTLLQNGWQRTEDFFECREIYFSGRYDHTELVAEPGRYGYCYTSAEEPEVILSVIGEEELTVQQCLDDLVQTFEECLVLQEGEGDYTYVYRDDAWYVNGRVYACNVNGNEHRMRVEVRYPASTELQTEGYEFYLR